MTPPAEPPTRRIKRVERSFTATTSELADIVDVLGLARRLLADEIAHEEGKGVRTRLPPEAMKKMKDRLAMLDRVTREISA